MTLTRTPRRAFTSITIASRRRSSSPSSASPELLHLSELSTDAVDGNAAEKLPTTTEEHRKAEPTPAPEPGRLLSQEMQSQTSQLQPGTQTRQVAIGGPLEEVPPEASSREPDTDTQSVGHGEESSVQYGCVSARGAKEGASPSPPESPAPSGHVSHVHLTPSPRTSSHSLIPLIASPHTDSDPAMRPKALLSVSGSSASSPDEGVGLSSPPEWCRNTELMRQQGPCTLHRAGERLPSAIHREVVSPQTTEAAGRLGVENEGLSCRPPVGWGGRCCGNSIPSWNSFSIYSNDPVFPLKRCWFCCLINRAAVRSSFTSLKLKLPSLLTPPWKAPTQVCSML